LRQTVGEFWVWCEIVCRKCAETTQGCSTSTNHIPRRIMALEAEKQGWVLEEREWYCPECVKEEK
jgi:hypothetical protein